MTVPCVGDDRYTTPGLPESVYRELVKACFDCPIIEECAAGIPGDPWWVIRGGQIRATALPVIMGEPCQYPECDQPIGSSRRGGRPSRFCEIHRAKHFRSAVAAATMVLIGTDAVPITGEELPS